MEIEKRIKSLRELLNYHSYKYYAQDSPEIDDSEYDAFYRELEKLESKRPDLITPDSPTQRVGEKPLEWFDKVTHAIQMQSLTDVFSEGELLDFDRKIREGVGTDVEYVVEKKIDGLSVSLIYKDGAFIRGATRGDGFIGEDVTQNLRTIRSIPLRLRSALPLLEVRGEVYISKKNFAKINEGQKATGQPLFANPRNAAAGSLRQLDPKVASLRNLDIFIFNIQRIEGKSFERHSDGLKYLSGLGFRVSPDYKTYNDIKKVLKEIRDIDKTREDMDFEIDGAVIKVNNLNLRNILGSTSRVPKWAVAYKYPAKEKETVIHNIEINVGRTGVLTPIAVLEPVTLAGSVVQRASLHNMDYIHEKDIKIGDTIYIRKAGEIIPEVIKVNFKKRTGDEIRFEMPNKCPICGSDIVREGGEAAHRCTGIECPAKTYQNIIHFASRNAMNIEGLGPATAKMLLEEGLIKGISDLYYLSHKRDALVNMEGMGEKSVDNLLASIEKSKNNNIDRLIFGFGIRHIGLRASRLLSKNFDSLDDLIEASLEEIGEIPEFGEKMAESLVIFFAQEQTKSTIENLKLAGVNMVSTAKEIKTDERFKDKVFVLTGALEGFTRDEATKIIEKFGGKTSGSVSKRTNYVLAGNNAGGKLQKAVDLKIEIVDEEMFRNMIGTETV
ncbi:MAG: NAD-dependent DNA ligase LigA [Clostridium sp.]|nr:NAD-dependent DNA ligase LigA [Clostridium sp.]